MTDRKQIQMSEAQQAIADAMSEAELADNFDELATRMGWIWCGFRPARQAINGTETYRTPVIGHKGFPDRTLARANLTEELLFVELKSQTGKLRPEQRQWRYVLGPRYHIIRPSDWLDGTIERLLA